MRFGRLPQTIAFGNPNSRSALPPATSARSLSLKLSKINCPTHSAESSG